MNVTVKQFLRRLRYAHLGVMCVTGAFAADQTLFNFDGATNLAQVVKTDAIVAAVKAGSGMAMRVSTGTNQPWPGVTLPAPDGTWDLSRFAQVVLKVKNAGTKRGTLNCRVDNPGADGTKNCRLLPAGTEANQLAEKDLWK